MLNQFIIFETDSYLDNSIREAVLELLDKTENNPDYKEIIPETQNSISIKEIREVISWIQLKPFQSLNKVALIAAAEKLTPEAQNCLLKTLEEPPKNSYIFLATSNPQSLLPTVRSRGVTMHTLRSPETKSAENIDEIIRILHADIKTQIQWIDSIAKITDSYEKKSKTLQFLKEVHNMIISNPNTNNTQQKLELIAKSQEAIKRNVNLKLVLENFLFNYQ